MNIPIFVINLDRSAERMQVIANRLTAMGLTYERFPGTDGHKMGRNFLESNYPRLLGEFDAGNKGGVGCLISHIELCKLIVSRGLDSACVIEDDAEFDGDFPAFVDAGTIYPAGIDAIKLEADVKRKTVMCSLAGRVAGRNLAYVPGSNTNGTACYIMTKEGARKFVEGTSKIDYVSADHFMFSFEQSSIRSLHILPYPARQSHIFTSTINEALDVQLTQRFEAPRKKRRRRTISEVWQIRSRRTKEVIRAFLNSRHIIGTKMLRLTIARVQSSKLARLKPGAA